ncbi:hypothetical protein [Anaerophilus nitritogenes]|uniref:hypothetical protein n=1 Tax=Anaerophilus nitritogenes TaxID=2498136 RepID=UPI00101BECAF|nr:hypothetical protein [Anaerophilus nitritogenes]
MTKYYYEKWTVNKRWSETLDKPQSYIRKETINIATDALGTWFPSSGSIVVNGAPRVDYNQTQNAKYLKYPSGTYYNMVGIRQTGSVAKVGDIGYFYKEEEPYNPNLYALYKVRVTKIPVYAGEKYEGNLLGWWYVTKNEKFITIYEHIYGKQNLLETIQAEEGIYPYNGIQDGYWYVKKGLVFAALKMKINGQLKTSENGWVKVDGVLREIDKIWVKVDGELQGV